jgi:sulfate adenylyltransferase
MTPVPHQFCPTARELDDLELLLSGGLAPLTGFDEPGSVVTLHRPEGATGEVELVDPEGLPLATVGPTGAVTALSHTQFGPFRRLHLSPAQTRARHAGATFVPVTGPLTTAQLGQLSGLDRVVLLALVGTGTPEDLTKVGLIRTTAAAATQLAASGTEAHVVAVSLASRGSGDAEVDRALGMQVIGNYAGPDPVLALADDDGGDFPDEIAAIVDSERPGPSRQGLVVFFTGLSGSGKSTLAQALIDRVLEQGLRRVTSLDGDVVRRNLSAGLGFSRVDRETNIRRIGWVAAEISHHGGVAVCSPIAPFAATRQQVRAMVEEAGGAFFLVHVATPLEECERRDRKGLYAKARRGEIPEFTGISSPYEEPEDAAIRVDTTGRTIPEVLDEVLIALKDAEYLALVEDPHPHQRAGEQK